MDKIKQLIQELDAEVNELYVTYMEAHEELVKYTGRTLNEEEVKIANALLEGIQNTFSALHPFYYFINHRYAGAMHVVKSYEDWIMRLKEAGIAKDRTPIAKEIIT